MHTWKPRPGRGTLDSRVPIDESENRPSSVDDSRHRQPCLALGLGRHRKRPNQTPISAGSRAAGLPEPAPSARSGSCCEIQGTQVDASIRTPQGIRFQVRGEVKLDETTSPRSLDWIKFSGADQQEFPDIPAIYKIDRDTFTVCNGGLGGRRPKEFTSGDGILAEVVVFERERPLRRRMIARHRTSLVSRQPNERNRSE